MKTEASKHKEEAKTQGHSRLLAKEGGLEPFAEPVSQGLPSPGLLSRLPAPQRAERLRQWQGQYGNQVVQRLLGAEQAAERPRLIIQPQLTVNAIDDPHEREAEQMAKAVVRRMQAPESGQTAVPQRLTPLSTGMIPPSREPDPAMRQGGVVDSHLERRIEQARGGGRPLDDGQRRPLEAAFGADFSAVRLHTGPEAQALSKDLSARAFTTEQDIFLREEAADLELLAHELTHVVQQNAAQQSSAVGRQIELPPIKIIGDPQFYARAVRSNQYYASNPPVPGWPYDDALRTLWERGAHEDFADRVRELQADSLGLTDKDVDGILGPKTASLLTKTSESESNRLEIVSQEATPDQISNGLLAYQPSLPLNAAKQRLLAEVKNLEFEIDRDKGKHEGMLRHRQENSVLGSIVDFFGMTSIPDIHIWDSPLLLLRQLREQLEFSTIETAESTLHQVREMVKKNKKQLNLYTDEMEIGANRVITGLEFVKDTSQAVIGTNSPGWGAGYSAILSAAEGLSEFSQGQALGWNDVLKRIRDWGADALFSFFFKSLDKQFKPRLESALGPYLNSIPESELLEMGLSRDSFVPMGTKLFVKFMEFIVDVGANAFQEAVKMTLDRLADSPTNTDVGKFLDELVLTTIREGLAGYFAEWMVNKATR